MGNGFKPIEEPITKKYFASRKCDFGIGIFLLFLSGFLFYLIHQSAQYTDATVAGEMGGCFPFALIIYGILTFVFKDMRKYSGFLVFSIIFLAITVLKILF